MPSTSGKSGSGYLTGQLLIAMPQMTDPRFERTVIYICAHTADGAMGLVVNREIEALTFPDLLKQLSIDAEVIDDKIQVLFGGPVETGRGFVLHSSDYVQNTTMLVDKRVGLTATMEVLKDIASGNGPKLNILALGYAGWGPGQLDAEIHANGWLSVPADDDLVFDPDLDKKWERALAKIGVDFSMLSGQAGHA
ncbi:MAG: YqgE/AlgH family protein [Proteobacteria bacterium]|nr:YqgE/AlgH family protein [Pseudomonadota bacterium]MCH8096819.1 YqgE/AlgH family protein [Pseudomonadota bacterium]